MILINLFPENLRKKKKNQFFQKILKSLPLEILVGAAGGLLIVLIGLHLIFQMTIFFGLGNYAHLKSKKESIAPEEEMVNKVMENLQILRRKINAVEKITIEKRISWAQKLNVISDVIPAGVWITKVALSENTFLIQGSAASKNQDEMISVGNFSSSLKKEKDFMIGLEDIEVGSIQRRKIYSAQVADFVIMVKLNEKFNE